jgi:hypothetical protein
MNVSCEDRSGRREFAQRQVSTVLSQNDVNDSRQVEEEKD